MQFAEKWDSGVWTNTGSIGNEYYATGDLLFRATYSYWKGGEQINDSKEEFAYNSAGVETDHSFFKWSEADSSWLNNMEVVTTNTPSGKKSSVLIKQWDDDGECDTTNQTTFTYNHDNLIQGNIIGKWDGSTFNPIVKTTYYYEDHAVSIPEVSNQGGTLAVYPVPAKNELTINLQWNNTQAGNAAIYDLQGRVWKQWQVPAASSYNDIVSVKELPSGNYFIRFDGDKNNVNALVLQQFTIVR
jgi:hypothetical protein